MGTWKATQIPLPPQLPPGGQMDIQFLKTTFDYVKLLANTISAIRNDLEFMLNGHIDANNIRANSIETKNLKAGAVTADKIDVNELSAITANLGHIISGLIESVEIYGSYIATSQGYPRAEMDSTQNLFGAYASPNNFIQIYTPNSGFSPTIMFGTPAGVAYMTYDIDDNAIAVSSNDANIHINTTQEVNILGRKGVWVNGQQIAGPI